VLRQQIAQWARDNGVTLKEAEPELPEELDDRRWDVIEPLLAIADMAGGEWPTEARVALIELCGTGSADSTEVCICLLNDIRSIFKTKNEDRLQTEVLLGSLMSLDESPWREHNRNGSPITARQLADSLRDFGIGSRDIHTGTGKDRKSRMGYVKGDFKDAWERYLPAELNAPMSSESTQHPCQPRQANVYAGLSEFSHPRQETSGGDRKSEESPTNTRVGGHGGDEGSIPGTEDGSTDVEPWLTLEELAKYTASSVEREASAPAQYQDWTPTDADLLDSQDEEGD
jgi:hypothetical protein